MKKRLIILITSILLLSCNLTNKEKQVGEMEKKVNRYAQVKLTADLSALSINQKEMLKLFIETSEIMDELFWTQAYGDKKRLLDTIQDEYLRKFVMINYGPWERLDGNKAFIESACEKPKGACFYPSDMTTEEFNTLADVSKISQYTLIRRNENGKLITMPYHVAYFKQVTKAADLLQKAASLSDNEGLKKYLMLRAEALLTDNYEASDMAWMDIKSNLLDFVVGPIENYEDQLFGYKTSYEAYILLRDISWSEKLEKYTVLLSDLQKKLPVNIAFKKESPGLSSDLGVYEVLYYAGDCNAGSKTIAVNLPNNEEIQLVKGSRRLQLKNAMKAKFDQILLPIAKELIVENQQNNITFDAFFDNMMFHEVAHGLGIKNTLTGKGTVRQALKDQYSALEEGKADILGLFLITELKSMGELQTNLMDNYATFMAGLFRSIRFGASSAHGKANLVCFNYFKEKGAFIRGSAGKYIVNFLNMQKIMNDLSNEILMIQGNGDYNAAMKMIEDYSIITEELNGDLNRINSKEIPVDIVFEQGAKALGL
jgi:hypothetical protein